MRFEEERLLWTVADVYSESECESFIGRIQASSVTLADNPLYRDQDRVIVDDRDAAVDLYVRLQPHLPTSMGDMRLVGLNERLRMYRYSPGQRFHPHMDHWYQPSPTRVTLHTVLVYFNDNFRGGETRFLEQIDRVITPRRGLVAIFQHKIRHEGCLVHQGTKFAMRTDTVFESSEPIGFLGTK
jgi:prolyl 4-hydroxylase